MMVLLFVSVITFVVASGLRSLWVQTILTTHFVSALHH